MQVDLGSETKKCPYCAEDIKFEAIACRYCGRDIPNASKLSTQTRPIENSTVEANSRSMGLSIASLILGIIASVTGLIDLGLIEDQSYDYILDSELGFLAIMSLTSLGLGIAAKVKQQRNSTGALITSIVSVVIFLSCTSYSQYV
jgi:hypothetical protein